MTRSKTKAGERAKKSEGENPIGIVAGFQQVVQDLLVPELKAIQGTLQHHGELIPRSATANGNNAKAECRGIRQSLESHYRVA